MSEKNLTSNEEYLSITAGDRFGRLVAVRPLRSTGKWLFECDCGTEKEVLASSVRTGHSRSCGCLNRDASRARHTTHGMAHTKIHRIWRSMLGRCDNPNTKRYDRYGGRGIKVCERWRSFENFYADMGERPAGLTLDRIDNDGDYEPSNCRWATQKQQHANRDRSVIITFNGETMAAFEWDDRMGYRHGTVFQRVVQRGWEIKRAILTPTDRKLAREQSHQVS